MTKYDIDLQYHTRKINIVPDALSRRPEANKMIQITKYKELLKEMRKLNLMVIQQIGASEQLMVSQLQPTLLDEIKKAQKRDPRLQKIREQVEAGLRSNICNQSDGTLYFGNRICVSQGEKVLAEAHSSAYSIYPGETKMHLNLKKYFWWNAMKREIAQYVAKCLVCQQVKAEHQ